MKRLSSTCSGFRPTVETLEDRCVPATFSVVGSTMTITGDGAAEMIDIRDNGDGDLTVVFGSSADVLAGRGTLRFASNISAVNVRGHGGNDIVHFFQSGDRTRSMSLDVRLGDGRDIFLADIEGDIDNTVLAMNVDGGDSGDFITVDASADVDIGSLGALAVTLDGGDWSVGRDVLTVNYAGEMDGLLAFTARGRGGPDHLHADVAFHCGSTGVMAGVLDGGQGDDHLFYHIHKDCPSDTLSIAVALVRGGMGDDSYDLTSNVQRRSGV